MLNRLSLVLLPVLFACAPVVTHGPRVHPGAELTSALGGTRPFCGSNTDTGCDAGLAPTWGMGARYGFTPREPGGVAALAGVSVPIGDPQGAELDGFVQAPSPGAWAWGGGALWSARHLMPYAQVGHVPAGDGPGWYVTAGYAHLYHDPSMPIDQTDDDGRVMVRPPRYWAPGAALTTHEGRASITFFVQGAFGSYVERETAYGPDGPVPREEVRKPVRTVLFGAAWAIGFRDIELPSAPSRALPPPRPRE